MHARVTRYEGATPDAVDDALEAKERVLPTESGQTEGMKGTVFLVDCESGWVVAISLRRDEAGDASERGRGDVGTGGVTKPGQTATAQRHQVALLSVEQAGQVD